MLGALNRPLTPLWTPRRRSAVFTPASLSGLALWLDASDTSTITTGAGASVSQWRDKSAHANNGNPGVSGTPTTGVHAINGLNTLTFDASSQSLTLTNSILGAGTTGFAVCSFNGLNHDGPFIGKLGGGSDAYFGMYGSVSQFYIFDTSVYALVNISRSATAKAYAYTTGTNAGAAAYGLYVDGVSQSTSQTSGTWAGSFDTIGNRGPSEWLDGNLGELIVYSRVLAADEIAEVSQYLRAKWGTA